MTNQGGLDQFRTKFGKVVMESIGTAILLFTIQVVSSSSILLAPLAIGGILMTIVYAGGPISGGHYNPAVSLAVHLRGRLAWRDMTHYWLYQLAGAYLGAVLGGIVAGDNDNDNDVDDPTTTRSWSVVTAGAGITTTRACLAELIYTFILCLIVLCVATHGAAGDNSYYGAAIGLVVLAGAVTVGPISGGAFNPAVVIGLALADSFHFTWYGTSVVLANMMGGVAAAAAFYLVAGPDEFPSSSSSSSSTAVNVGETTRLVGV